jgi:hypothetical protein
VFKTTFDGVIKSEFLTHVDEVCHKQTQPYENIILARNAELRKNPGAIRNMEWGQMVASIPMNMFEKAVRDGYQITHVDADISAREMARYLQSEDGKMCIVQGKN